MFCIEAGFVIGSTPHFSMTSHAPDVLRCTHDCDCWTVLRVHQGSICLLRIPWNPISLAGAACSNQTAGRRWLETAAYLRVYLLKTNRSGFEFFPAQSSLWGCLPSKQQCQASKQEVNCINNTMWILNKAFTGTPICHDYASVPLAPLST